MVTKVLYVERKPSEFVSIEKVFRQIASSLSSGFITGFQQVPFGFKASDSLLNLLFFRKRAADIYHVTGHIHYIVLRLQPDNTVLTFHDLRFLNAKGRLRRLMIRKLYLEWPVRRLKYLTAISEQTKKEIEKTTGCGPGKVRMLDVPLFDHFRRAPQTEFRKDRPVILQVGTLPNKNLERLAVALNGIDCVLRIIGKLSREQRISLEDNQTIFANVTNLTNDEMYEEYVRADIVAFCSTLEGFGLPVIEAQAVGRVVVTSNLSPLTDTAGKGAEFVDPLSIQSIRSGILRVVDDDPHRERLIELGWENAERFRSDHVARQYELLYNEIMAERSK